MFIFKSNDVNKDGVLLSDNENVSSCINVGIYKNNGK